ncbi:hypothetical protein ON010_g14232 [Phytophthora cinnamomi]|nr:hypothetical protein ON010_g14232 [Phytophthora cinnamomi]
MPPSFQTGYPVMIELSPDFILQSERRRKGLRSANTRTSAMNSCTLFPPNTQNLSDRVISSVVQRAWVRDGDISNEADSLEDAGDLHTPPMRPQFSAYTPARRENQYQPADVSENTPVRPNAVRPVEMTGKRRMKHRATRDFVLDQHDVANSSLSIKSTTTRGLSRKSSTINSLPEEEVRLDTQARGRHATAERRSGAARATSESYRNRGSH